MQLGTNDLTTISAFETGSAIEDLCRLLWRGTGGGGGGGGRRDLYDGGKRERNSKSQAFFICYCLLPVKETNPTTFLVFHLTFSEA